MTDQLTNEAAALIAKARTQLQSTPTERKDETHMEQMMTSMSAAEAAARIAATTATTATTAPDLTSQVAQLYTGGKSIVEVAAALNITYGKARKLLTASGTPLRDSSERLKGRTRPVKEKA